ncbi:MAG: hypothetical protein R8M11_09020 [Gallionella sp.]
MTTKKSATVTAPKKLPSRKSTAKKSPALKKLATAQTSKRAGKSVAENRPKKSKKEQKVKVVRDSFTMPQNEYQKIAEIKAICLKSKVHVKKSEVLRAGLKVLGKLSNAQLKKELGELEKIKTGRPKKH